MSKFKVGDRVKLVNPMELGRNFWGRTGVVEYIEKNNQDALDYAVEFDEESPKFHDCFGHCVKNHGYWCNDEMIEIVEQDPKQEYYNGKIFVVKGYFPSMMTWHIYEIKDGCFIDSTGSMYPIGEPLKNFENVENYFLKGYAPQKVEVMEVKED